MLIGTSIACSLLSSDRMLWHTLGKGSKRAEQLKGKMQSTALEMSHTLAAQMPVGLLSVFPASSFSFLLYFLFLPYFPYQCILEGSGGSRVHTVIAGLTSPPPFHSFVAFSPPSSHFPNACLTTPTMSNLGKSPCTINSHYQRARFYGQGAFLLRPLSGLQSHNYKFTLEPPIPCWFATSSGLPFSCFSLVGICTLTQGTLHICKMQKVHQP